MLMLTVLLLVALASLVAIVAVLVWPQPSAGGNGYDFCDCGAPATHELAGNITDHPDGGAATVGCYCKRHAPKGAVRV